VTKMNTIFMTPEIELMVKLPDSIQCPGADIKRIIWGSMPELSYGIYVRSQRL
jgi:hypothetical protein